MPATVTDSHRALCYETSRWERCLFEGRSVRGVLATALDATAKAQPVDWEASPTNARALAIEKHRKDAADFGTEVFARLYGEPSKLAQPVTDPAWAAKAHELIGALPEFEALRESVANDPDMAALAAAECLGSIAGKLPGLAGKQSASGAQSGPNVPGKTDPASEEAARAAVRSALRAGIARAEQRIGDAREALAGLAPGLEAAPATHEQPDTRRFELAESLIANPRLREVLRRAGRVQRLARDRRTVRDERARQEVVDVERGADLARILPAGLARLRHPLLRRLALREIVERQALQYRLEGREPLGRGPVVVIIDRSSSMADGSGSAELWASATAIAVLGGAVREHRPITTIEFTTSVDEVHAVAANGVGRVLDSRDPARTIRSDLKVQDVALSLASRRSCGGTEFGPVLNYALRCGVLEDRADFIFVTDGLASADPETLDRLTEAKARGLRVYGLTVAGGSFSAAIEAICDVAIDIDRVEDVAAAIASAMPQ